MTDRRLKNGNCDECVVVPATDICESTNEYSLKMEMPGVTKENLEITLENNIHLFLGYSLAIIPKIKPIMIAIIKYFLLL